MSDGGYSQDPGRLRGLKSGEAMTTEAHLRFHTEYRTVDVEIYGDEVHLEIDAPWAGSTDSGFGQNLAATFSKEEALEIARAIFKHFGAK